MTDKNRGVGRPTQDPKNKMSTPFRCLITPGVHSSCLAAMDSTSLNQSDLLHLFIYEGLRKLELLDPELADTDQTFKNLREAGLV